MAKVNTVVFVDKAAEMNKVDILKLKELGIFVVEVVGKPADCVFAQYVYEQSVFAPSSVAIPASAGL